LPRLLIIPLGGRSASDRTALRMAQDRNRVFRRNATGVSSGNRPLNSLAAANELWRCAVRRWGGYVDPWRIYGASFRSAWFRTNRTSAASCQSRRRGPHNILASMDLFRAGLFDRGWSLRRGRASRLYLVFVRALPRPSRSRKIAAPTAQASPKPS
jgi:hypothetical protein